MKANETKPGWWCLPVLVDADVFSALENIVQYSWDDELADFQQNVDSDSNAYHIFYDLQLAHIWLNDQKKLHEFFPFYYLAGCLVLGGLFLLPDIVWWGLNFVAGHVFYP